MAYFIFLKSLRSLGEFRKKILMSKFLLNLLVQISKALVYSKIKFYSEKNFPRHFRPIQPFGPAMAHSFLFQPAVFLPPLPHWASASRTAQPILTAQSATFFFLPHRSRARTVPPAGLAPPPGSTLTPPPEEKKMAASIPFIPPLIGAISPSSITGNRRLQPGLLKLLQHRPLKALGLASAI
jgi:hypothetical protein